MYVTYICLSNHTQNTVTALQSKHPNHIHAQLVSHRYRGEGQINVTFNKSYYKIMTNTITTPSYSIESITNISKLETVQNSTTYKNLMHILKSNIYNIAYIQPPSLSYKSIQHPDKINQLHSTQYTTSIKTHKSVLQLCGLHSQFQLIHYIPRLSSADKARSYISRFQNMHTNCIIYILYMTVW